MIRLAIAGASGRMGQCVLDCAGRDGRFVISAALTSSECEQTGAHIHFGHQELTITESLETDCDVLIDFTDADGTMHWLEICASKKIPMVIGATGHNDQQLEIIQKVSCAIPIVKAPNCSVGIQAISNVLASLANELGDDFDIEIVESHHRHKVDAPSGTALSLAQVLLKSTKRTKSDLIYGRNHQTAQRAKNQIGIHSIRMGEMVGQHEIHFSGPGETITIHHTAHSRETFATGALRAAAWVIEKSPSLYTMQDVLS